MQEEVGLAAGGKARLKLAGAEAELLNTVDALFCGWADGIGAERHLYPPLLPADKLHRADHFSSFPHQVLMAVSADPDEGNLHAFSAAPLAADGSLNLPDLAPAHYCLTPGACFPIYFNMEGESHDGPQFITVRSSCFRRETYEEPLARQMSFNMREIVCIGTQSDVESFLAGFRTRVENLFARIAFPVEFKQATDPFFNPGKNRKFIMQKVVPLKHEMVFDDRLAIGSINNHKSGFGELFNIRIGDQVAHSGCVAFGLERWVYAVREHFGADPAGWPAWN
jgi:seryl-tRNA synthetase